MDCKVEKDPYKRAKKKWLLQAKQKFGIYLITKYESFSRSTISS